MNRRTIVIVMLAISAATSRAVEPSESPAPPAVVLRVDELGRAVSGPAKDASQAATGPARLN